MTGGGGQDAEFDLVVFGASGFTGRLICERLVERGRENGLRWAMAGRSEDKLVAVRKAIGAEAAGLIVADADDPASLAAMAARTRTVIAAAGPFQLYGSAVVAACAANGTDYLDLSGEVVWMRRMIDAHADAAARGGARILFSCGFDSVPFELGVVFLQATACARFGVPVPRAKGRVRRMIGRFSGGTAASGHATRAAAKREPEVAMLLRDPFCLTPGFQGPAQPDLDQVAFDHDLGAWTTPFVMASINSSNIHRSNALGGHGWGTDFRYDEALVVGPGAEDEARARAMAAGNPLGADAGLRPGEGPSRAERDAGWYDLLFIGHLPDGRDVRVAVTGDRDPGYGSTARIIVETALCLRDKGHAVAPGIWTPGAALGLDLVDRLQRHAGLSFQVEERA